MAKLNYLLKGLMLKNKDGSFSTQTARKNVLMQAANQLKDGGYKLSSPNSIRPKHVDFLLQKWKREGLSSGTIKNRMAHIRWWASKVGKSSMLPGTNDGSNQAIQLNIDKRSYISSISKARDLDEQKLSTISDPFIRASLELQKLFGLRREEAIKFTPSYAIRGDKIVLKGSWTKGGRPRSIPILTKEQKDLLERVSKLAAGGSLIHRNMNYKQQLARYERQTSTAKLDKMHGLRHRYAQERYFELSGNRCPHQGGLKQKDMTTEQREQDRLIRLKISAELGHAREEIVKTYIG